MIKKEFYLETQIIGLGQCRAIKQQSLLQFIMGIEV